MTMGSKALPGENDADMAAATHAHTRGPSQPFSSGLHHAWLRLPLLKDIKLKSNVASDSFSPYFPYPGSEEWGEENKNLDCN